MDPTMPDPAINGVIQSLSTLGPAGVVGGAWIWSMLQQRKMLQKRLEELEDRLHDILKDMVARKRAFDWAGGHQHCDKEPSKDG